VPNNPPLTGLEEEVSALRPRPSELPPEKPLVSPYRQKAPSDLSLLYQALPLPSADGDAPLREQANVRRTRGYVPKAPHEYFPPPPPPSKRASFRSSQPPESVLGATPNGANVDADQLEDETLTQVRPPAPMGAAALDAGMGYGASSVSPAPPPAWSPAAVAAYHVSRSPLPPPTTLSANTARLPAPPGLPQGFGPSLDDEALEDWTSNKHVEALHLTPPPTYESVHPTALSIPAPVQPSKVPGLGLPVGWVSVASASLLGAALAAAAFVLPERGQLLVDVTNQAFAPISNAHVYVNGDLACSQTPCAVKLNAAPVQVRVTAPGYQGSPDESVVITSEAVTLHKVQLGASSDTGIDVRTTIPNLQLYVDGRRIGSLPRKVMGLPPGEHTVVISGGETFTAEERRIHLDPNQTLVIDDLQPKLKSGTLELVAGDNADGARVTLDGRRLTLPQRLTLEPDRTYVLAATKDGYEPFEQTLRLDASKPTLELAVDLVRVDEASPRRGVIAHSAPTLANERPTRSSSDVIEPSHSNNGEGSNPYRAADSAPGASAPDSSGLGSSGLGSSGLGSSGLGAAMRQSVGLPADAPSESKAAVSKAATGSGVLNIVTTPSALVLLDGKPVGRTPTQVNVSAGSHSVVLIHEETRKRATINVEPGANKTIKASF
jgi:hypothetical protein